MGERQLSRKTEAHTYYPACLGTKETQSLMEALTGVAKEITPNHHLHGSEDPHTTFGLKTECKLTCWKVYDPNYMLRVCNHWCASAVRHGRTALFLVCVCVWVGGWVVCVACLCAIVSVRVHACACACVYVRTHDAVKSGSCCPCNHHGGRIGWKRQ